MNLAELSSNQLLALFYILSNVITLLVCLLLLYKTREMKQTSTVFFKRLLVCLVLYYSGEILWAHAYFGIMPKADIHLKIARIFNYSVVGLLSYCWLMYVEVIINPKGLTRKNKILYSIPTTISILLSIFLCSFFSPEPRTIENYLMVFGIIAIPFAYVLIGGARILYYRFKSDKTQKSRYTLLAIWPFAILAASVAQVLIAGLPVFCYASTFTTIALCLHSQEQLIFTDGLTGIYNRKMINNYAESFSNKEEHYVMMVDVNKFKEINDSYGHLEGDKALIYVASVIRRISEEKHFFFGRYGGDEFIIITNDANEDDVKEFIKKVNDSLDEADEKLGFPISASIGYHKINNSLTLHEALAKADKLLYEEKEIAHTK